MSHSLNAWERLVLLAILAAGAWLRFQHTGDIEYNIDQVYPIWQAIQTLDEEQFPLTGQGTSVLFDNPPLTGYLYLPVVALARQPIAVYVVTILLNTFAIWLAYRTLTRLLGPRPALAGAALFAANPWIIEDSRRTWVQALAPFFVALIIWALVPVLTGQTRRPARRTLLAITALALFAHTYLLAYALVVPVGMLIVVYWRRIPKRALAAGAMLFALMTALYAAGLVQHWSQTANRAEAFASGQARLSDEALSHALRLVTGGGYAKERGVTAPANDAELRQTLSQAAHMLWTALVATGILAALVTHLRRESPPHERRAATILLLWFVVPIAMMSYVSRVVHPFYLLLTIPAGHGLAGLALRPLFRHRLGNIIVVVLVAGTGMINGVNVVRFAQNTAAHPGEDLPETLPLAHATALGERLRAELEPGMAVVSPMEEWTLVTLAGRAVRAEKLDDLDRAVIVPPAGAVIVTVERPPGEPVAVPLYASPAGSPLALSDGTVLALWRTTPATVSVAHPAGIPTDIDVTLVGWTLSGDLRPGQTAWLDLFWRVERLHPDRGIWTFAPFAHLFDADGTRFAVVDGPVIPALAWQVDDLLVYRLTLAVPEDITGPVAVSIGLFDGVRLRDDGTRGVNAIFYMKDGEDTRHIAALPIIVP